MRENHYRPKNDNSVQDGLPHVRWAGTYVTFDGPHPATGRRVVSTGGNYIRVEEGWVHISESAIPTLIGRLMELYGLERAGRASDVSLLI